MNIEIFKNSQSSEIQTTKNAQHEGSKLKPIYLGRKNKRGGMNNLMSIRRCDICLELEKYSDSLLIECVNCKARCHKKCIEIEVKGKIAESKWECLRCINSNIIKKDVFNIK